MPTQEWTHQLPRFVAPATLNRARVKTKHGYKIKSYERLKSLSTNEKKGLNQRDEEISETNKQRWEKKKTPLTNTSLQWMYDKCSENMVNKRRCIQAYAEAE